MKDICHVPSIFVECHLYFLTEGGMGLKMTLNGVTEIWRQLSEAISNGTLANQEGIAYVSQTIYGPYVQVLGSMFSG